MTRHARPMAEYRRERRMAALRAAAYHAAEAVVFVAVCIAIYAVIIAAGE